MSRKNQLQLCNWGLKNDLGLRPNHHRIERPVYGHIFISILAYHLLHHILYTLRLKGDRGMRGEANLEASQKSDFDYIIALKHKEAREFLKTHNSELEGELFDQRSNFSLGSLHRLASLSASSVFRDPRTY